MKLDRPVTEIERLTIEYSVYYAVQRPVAPADAPPALLIALHGYGQSCKGFIQNFSALAEENVLVVAPQGPNQFYWQSNPPKVGFAWLTQFNTDQTRQDLMAYLGRLVDKLKNDMEFDPKQVYLFGFSNGAALALRMAVSGSVEPAGVAICCGDLPVDVEKVLSERTPFPVWVSHGKNDPLVPLDKGKEAERRLIDHGFPVETYYYDGGHEITAGVRDAFAQWLRVNRTKA